MKLSLNLINLSNFFEIRYNDFYSKHSKENLSRKNRFIKSCLQKKKVFKRNSMFFSSFTVHNSIKEFRSWDPSINFFIKFNILKVFRSLNRNRLKNIFCKVIHDIFFWQEIEKMINSNFVNICSEKIYLAAYNNNFSFLSRFLLNVYLSELDYYVNSISSKLNNKFNIFLGTLNRQQKNDFNYIFFSYIPLKMEKKLFYIHNLRKINLLLYNNIRQNYVNNLSDSKMRFFSLKIFYLRFLNFGLLGIKSSLAFTRSLYTDLITFTKTNLHLEFVESGLYSSLDKSLFFLGFNLRKKLVSLKRNEKLSLLNKKYLNLLKLRIFKYKQNITKIFLKRFKLELSSYVRRRLESKNIKLYSSTDAAFWTYLFQFESIRSSQINKFIGSFDTVPLVTNNIYSFIRSKTSTSPNYNKYSLKIYTNKIRFLLDEIFSKTPSFINSSIYSCDLSVVSSLKDFEKNILISIQKLNKDNIITLKPFNRKSGNVDSLFYTSLQSKNLFKLSQLYSSSNFLKSAENFVLLSLIPTKYCFEKFRKLGFMHPVKNRAVGNPNYLSFEDSYIIKSFGYLSYSILTWFRCSNNFTKAKILVEFIRQSCFLTLCRKHNKNKSWVYSVYTPDLLLTRNLFGKKSFFPSRKLVFSFSVRYVSHYNNFLDEKFFLEN